MWDLQHSTWLFFVLRVTSIRLLTLSSRPSAKSTDDSAVKDEPIKFSTSKASHKIWKVHGSMGSQFEQPWWKVLPVSLFCISFILWCTLRSETDVDRNLYENIFELSDEEKEQKWMGHGFYCMHCSRIVLLPCCLLLNTPLMLGDNVHFMLTTVIKPHQFFSKCQMYSKLVKIQSPSTKLSALKTQFEVADSLFTAWTKLWHAD